MKMNINYLCNFVPLCNQKTTSWNEVHEAYTCQIMDNKTFKKHSTCNAFGL
jgi:hypothetical protein